jgi:hypothetical protein
MPGNGVIVPPLDAPAHVVLDTYLAALATRLTGPAPMRAAILAELHDGLLEAVDAYQACGLTPGAAANAALAEFGDPEMLAIAFRPGLAAAQARRVGLGLLLTGPFVGILWVSAMASPLPPWRHALSGVWVVVPVLSLAVTAGALAAVLAVVSTGRLSRWLPDGSRIAPLAAVSAGLSAAVADLIGLAMLTASATTAPGSLSWGLIMAAAVASLVRLACVGRVVPRCLAASA